MKKIRFILIMFLVMSLLLAGCNAEKSKIKDELNLDNLVVKDSNEVDELKEKSEPSVEEPAEADRLVADNLIVDDLNGIDESTLTLYTMDIDLDTENMSYKGKQSVNYVNNTDIDLEEIFFHVYPNAFKDVATIPLIFSDVDDINKEDYLPGYIDIDKISGDKKSLNWNVEGDKNTILHINLDKPLKIGENIEIYLEYQVKIPTTEDRFGYHDKGINIGNWYPVLAVYDEDGWNLDPLTFLGDPFYSEVSNYKVNITVPEKYEIAISGKILSETIDKGKRKYEIQAQLMRDIAWVASEEFVIREKFVDGTVVTVYSVNKDEAVIEKALYVVGMVLRTFSKAFGEYPYGQYSIVITRFETGMEYPGLVFISDEYDLWGLEKTIVHETAHQWWYGLVGNDQIDEAWLDESFATYSEVIYMSKTYGESYANDYFNVFKEYYKYAVQYLGDDEVVTKSLSEFSDWGDYGALVYKRGSIFLGKIKEDFGEEVLYEILSEYFNKYKFKIAKTQDFIEVCEDITGVSFDALVNEYLYGK